MFDKSLLFTHFQQNYYLHVSDLLLIPNKVQSPWSGNEGGGGFLEQQTLVFRREEGHCQARLRPLTQHSALGAVGHEHA